MSILLSIPPELKIKIFSLIDIKSLDKLLFINKEFNTIIFEMFSSITYIDFKDISKNSHEANYQIL